MLDVGQGFTVLINGVELELVVDHIQEDDSGAHGMRIQLQDAKSWMQERRASHVCEG